MDRPVDRLVERIVDVSLHGFVGRSVDRLVEGLGGR